jgi:hypothetical protein
VSIIQDDYNIETLNFVELYCTTVVTRYSFSLYSVLMLAGWMRWKLRGRCGDHLAILMVEENVQMICRSQCAGTKWIVFADREVLSSALLILLTMRNLESQS